MKRMFLILCLLAFLTGCTEDSIQTPCNFYYLQREITNTGPDSVVAAQIVDAGDLSPQEMISQYLIGVPDSHLISPFPSGIQLIAYTQSEGYVSLIVSDELASLSGMDLTLACVCLSKTCMETAQAESVEIRCQTQKLNGNESVIVTSDFFRLQDSYLPNTVNANTIQPQEEN